ncbi:carbohydrate ABC transporter permease [Anaerosporobacter sp.]|uniref:carbohydrate ABC transporter permease n=1 Tax=Anaerosporobacter sp. TaxID=1872529 RepID=UPI00286F1C3D|nr:carbohydrate ABC transporter permease [Anaerosporobacter sp.]
MIERWKEKRQQNKDEIKDTFIISSPFGRVMAYVLLIIFLILVIAPLLIIVNISLKTNAEYMMNGVYSFPEKILNFQNYVTAFISGKYGMAFINTAILICVSVPVSILVGTMVAYALGRFEFRLKKLMFILFLIPTFIPGMTVTIATFTLIKNLGLFNTRLAGMLLYIGTDIMQIYIFLQFISQIPFALDESAKLDGASRFRVYWSIILPQMKPAIATCVILKVLSIYNDFFTPYMYMPKSNLRTVATALNTFAGDRMADWPLMSAAIVFVALPTLILYFFMQRFIINGVSDGAVK